MSELEKEYKVIRGSSVQVNGVTCNKLGCAESWSTMQTVSTN